MQIVTAIVAILFFCVCMAKFFVDSDGIAISAFGNGGIANKTKGEFGTGVSVGVTADGVRQERKENARSQDEAIKKVQRNSSGNINSRDVTNSDKEIIQKMKTYVQTSIANSNGNGPVAMKHEHHLRKLRQSANGGKGLTYAGETIWKKFVVEWKAKNQELITKAQEKIQDLDSDDEDDEKAITELQKEIEELRAEQKMTVTRLNIIQRLLGVFGMRFD